MPIAPLRNAYLHYAVDGPERAPAVVLSNSLGTDFHLWDSQVMALRQHFRVVRYDTRGHGGSTGRPEEYSIADLGGDVVELLNYLNIDRAHVCGISLGGMTALWLAINAPHRVNHIMPCNTAARLGTVQGWTDRIAQVKEHGLASIADATMERWFTPPFRAKSKAKVEIFRQALIQMHAPGYISCCAALRDADLRDSIGSITAPTLAMSATSDPVTPPPDGQYLQQQIPGAKYLELKAAHISNVELPDAFSAAMLSFFSARTNF